MDIPHDEYDDYNDEHDMMILIDYNNDTVDYETPQGPQTQDETAFGGGDTTPVIPKEKIEIAIRSVERHFRIKLNREQAKNFSLDEGRLMYKKVFTDSKGKIVEENVYITQKNGEFYSQSTLEKNLGADLARNVFGLERGKSTPKQATILNEFKEELPSSSGIANANDIELKTILNDTSRNVEKLRTVLKESKETSTEDLFKFPLRELLGLDKTMQTIRGELTFAAAEKIKLIRHIEYEQKKLDEIEKDPWYQDKEQQREKIKEEIRERMSQKNDELKAQEERIKIIKGKLNSQVTNIKETIVKLTDNELSLTEKLRILFREQGITLTTIFTALGLIISTIVVALTGTSSASASASGKTPPPKDENKLKKWVKNVLQRLANALSRLAGKAAAALPGIIGSVIGAVLNYLSKAVGFLAKNTWAFIVFIVGLIAYYLYGKLISSSPSTSKHHKK